MSGSKKIFEFNLLTETFEPNIVIYPHANTAFTRWDGAGLVTTSNGKDVVVFLKKGGTQIYTPDIANEEFPVLTEVGYSG